MDNDHPVQCAPRVVAQLVAWGGLAGILALAACPSFVETFGWPVVIVAILSGSMSALVAGSCEAHLRGPARLIVIVSLIGVCASFENSGEPHSWPLAGKVFWWWLATSIHLVTVGLASSSLLLGRSWPSRAGITFGTIFLVLLAPRLFVAGHTLAGAEIVECRNVPPEGWTGDNSSWMRFRRPPGQHSSIAHALECDVTYSWVRICVAAGFLWLSVVVPTHLSVAIKNTERP